MTLEGGGSGQSGDGLGRALLGVMGVVTTVGGIAMALLAVLTWSLPYVPAAPGIVVTGYGTTLVLGCAFYNDVEVATGLFGMPRVKAQRHRQTDQA
jgi:hypothetical protein